MQAVDTRRCCAGSNRGEFDACYASALVYGTDSSDKLRAAVEDLERRQDIASCFTAWCPRCRGNYMLTSDLGRFPCPSAHHTHKLALLARLRADGIYHALCK
jgi:hypothetical protein